MPDRIHVQRVTREQLHRVADGQGWAFVVEVDGKVVGVRVEVQGYEAQSVESNGGEEAECEQ